MQILISENLCLTKFVESIKELNITNMHKYLKKQKYYCKK